MSYKKSYVYDARDALVSEIKKCVQSVVDCCPGTDQKACTKRR